MSIFCRVIEDNIENDFNAGSVQRLHHAAKFIECSERVRMRAIGLVRCKKGDRRVTPVVRPAWGRILRIELKHGKQLDRGNAQLLKVRDLLDESGVCATFRFRQTGAGVCGKTAHMHLVNDGAGPRPLQGNVTLPVIRVWVRDHALHGRGGVVAFATGCLTAIVFRHHDGAAIWVE